jgi:membrane peptidoglycan carboxypeptidase
VGVFAQILSAGLSLGRLIARLLLGFVLALARVAETLASGAAWLTGTATQTKRRASPATYRNLHRAAIAGAVGIPAAVLLFLSVAAVTNPYLEPELGYAKDRSSAVAVLDRDGTFLGILPPPFFADWNDGSRPDRSTDHAALRPASIPPVWRDCVYFLEDSSFISRRIGIDPLAFVKAGYDTLTGERRRGASTLMMQAARSLRGLTPSQEEAPGLIAARKGFEIFGAHTLVGMIDRRDEDGFARIAAMHAGP